MTRARALADLANTGIFSPNAGLSRVGINSTSPSVTLDVGGGASFTGNVSVGGTLTYDDVTNIDSVGIITAQSGIHVTGGSVGIGTNNPVGNLEVRDSKANLIVAKDGLTVKANSAFHTSYDNVQLGAGGGLASYSTATATADTQFLHNAYRHSGGNWKYRYADTAARLRVNSPGRTWIFESAASGSADGDITFSEQLRITSNGDLMTGGITSGAGKVQVGGGLRIAGSATHTDTSSPYIYRTSGVDNLCISTSALERLRIKSDGNVGVGYDNPSEKLVIKGTTSLMATNSTNRWMAYTFTDDTFRLNYNGAGADELTIDSAGDMGLGVTPNNVGSMRTLHIKGPSSEGAAIRLQADGDTADSHDFQIYKNASAAYLRVNGTDPLRFYLNGGDRALIDSSGRLLINTDVSRIVEDSSGNGPQGKIQIEGLNSDAMLSIIAAKQADTFRSGCITLGAHRGSLGGTPTILQDDDTVGGVLFAAGDGSDMRTRTAQIISQVDGSPSANDVPGSLVFSTRQEGGSLAKRLTIQSNGSLRLTAEGSTANPNARIDTSGDNVRIVTMKDGAGGCGLIIETQNSGSVTERVRIHDDGEVELDGSASLTINEGSPSGNYFQEIAYAPSSKGCLYLENFAYYSNQPALVVNDQDTNNARVMEDVQFQRNGTLVGYIRINPGSVTFSTNSSDRRLKKNFEDWTEDNLSKFRTLSPKLFNWIDDEDGTEKIKGFIAQDNLDKFPEAYPLTESSDRYSFNPSGMVAYIMKALQEAATKIETLESKVAALEG